MFKKSINANAINTCLLGSVVTNYKQLQTLFGKPGPGDDYKVSGEWIFFDIDDPSVVFTLYDWKSTAKYDSEDLPSVRKFRALPQAEFHIGGHPENTEAFERFSAWLQAKLCGK
jgi:hypothetical protein